jgi:hypothetical protein
MRWLVACLALSACSRIFGLDGVSNDDRDGDHVPDAIDNCPSDPNPDQSDVDGDGIGDRCQLCTSPTGADDDGDGIANECDGCDNRGADDNHDGVPDACEHLDDAGVIVINPMDGGCPLCQACALGPPHDEDGDHLADACDPCPIAPPGASATEDADGDGIAIACDASNDAPSHQLFDPFSEPNQAWYEIGAWTVTHDQLRPLSSFDPSYRQLGIGATHFAVRAEISAQGGIAGSARGAVRAVRGAPFDSAAPVEAVSCAVTSSGTGNPQLALTLETKGNIPATILASLPFAVSYRVELEYDGKNNHCRARVAPGDMPVEVMAPEGDPSTDAWLTGLTAQGLATTWFGYYQLASDN